SMFKAFGASPTSINFSEVYSSLQTHLVEGQENALSLINFAKLYEVQKYCSITNHMWDGYWCLANRDAFDALPGDLRDIAVTALNDAARGERADLARVNLNMEQELGKKGLIFNKPDTAPFREALKKAGFYQEWRNKYGPEAWGLLEKYAGSLG
ncbi:MAG TPA: TRAP transporter substrate-binding protein, partial [Stellaceae bacterium]|nr:TRAP transporter substrate-binding protein [Stellaceae bacterium]